MDVPRTPRTPRTPGTPAPEPQLSDLDLPDERLTATWRDQLLELDLPGVGPVTAWVQDAADGAAAQPAGTPRAERGSTPFPPTAPPAAEHVRKVLNGREPLTLERAWLVLPTLGPVVPTRRPPGITVADLSGRRPTLEVRPSRAPSALSADLSRGIAGRPRDLPRTGWFRRPLLAEELRRRGVPVGLGALVGPGREWSEPAVAVREDLLAVHPDQALEAVRLLAVRHGQAAVLRLGPAGSGPARLDIRPTGADPRLGPVEGSSLTGLPVRVAARPPRCPLRAEDGCLPCRPVGGPWIARSHRAQLDWEARRSQALATTGCGVCFGEALPPEPGQPPVPRLAPRTPAPQLDRLHLRDGQVMRIDPLS